MCGGWGGGGRSIPNLSPRGLALGLAPHPSSAKHDHSAYGGQAGDAGSMGSNVCGGWGLRRRAVGSHVPPRWCSLAGSPIVLGQTRQKSVSRAGGQTRRQYSVDGAKASGPAGCCAATTRCAGSLSPGRSGPDTPRWGGGRNPGAGQNPGRRGKIRAYRGLG